MALTEKHVEVMEAVKDGATIYGYLDAKLLREVQKEHPEYINVVDNLEELSYITDTKFDGKEQLPYFGAILTAKGKKYIEKAKKA